MNTISRNFSRICLITACLAGLPSAVAAQDARKTCIDRNWTFHYGEAREAVSPDFNDDSWRTLDLPHDWSVETEAAALTGNNTGPFSPNNPGGSATGQTVGGEGWYRKTFTLSAADQGKRISLYFEGVYAQSEVWLNGIKVYYNPYGYSSYRFDITDYCRPAGEENVITVRAVNEGRNTRWYAGSGIYRHVWLLKTPEVHLDEWETAVTTEGLTDEMAEIHVTTTVFNQSGLSTDVTAIVQLLSPDGKQMADADTTTVSLNAYDEAEASWNLQVEAPQAWSTETPQFYTARLLLTDGENTTDRIDIPFGIRTLEFSAGRGFLLNGEPMELQGGCVHHDHGLLGAASYDRAEERKVELLKQYGFNAVRCSHNIPSEHFLTACDRIGLLVIDEAFDQWRISKNPDDYARFFDEYSDRDLQIMVKRDRNHPSIIMWSIGNEIPGRADEDGVEIAHRFREQILRLDPTRAVTAGVNDFWDKPQFSWDNDVYRAFQHLDACGYNYMYGKYESDHAAYPDRVMYGSESYPKQASQNWDLVEQHPYVIGDFVWTAMDYLGEAGIAHALYLNNGESNPQFMDWPWYNGWCGDIDLIGEKKPQSYYRDVIWRIRPITMAVEPPVPAGQWQAISGWGWQNERVDWTFPGYTENDHMTVNVYTRAPRVRLYLNDELLGEQAVSDTYWAGFSVPYRPGTLRAVEWDGTSEGASFELKTTGSPVGIRLRTDRTTITADGTDLAYVVAELVDADGQVVRTDDRRVTFSAGGAGTLLASGNASPNDMESFRSPAPMLFEGKALAILRSTDEPGEMTLTASCDGFNDASVTITTTEPQAEGPDAVSSPLRTEQDFQVYSANRRIYVTGTDDYRIYTAGGMEADRGAVLTSGIYLVRSGGTTRKVIVR